MHIFEFLSSVNTVSSWSALVTWVDSDYAMSRLKEKKKSAYWIFVEGHLE
jgi:hypothetical protein